MDEVERAQVKSERDERKERGSLLAADADGLRLDCNNDRQQEDKAPKRRRLQHKRRTDRLHSDGPATRLASFWLSKGRHLFGRDERKVGCEPMFRGGQQMDSR